MTDQCPECGGFDCCFEEWGGPICDDCVYEELDGEFPYEEEE